MTTTPRGVRNNNPGNIDYNPRNNWQGQVGIEVGVAKPRFARFSEAKWGIRALAKLLLNYRGKDGMPGVGKPGIDTPLEFINRWAPSTENNTRAYAQAIAKRLGVSVLAHIDITDPTTLTELVTGIIIHENGYNPYDAATIAAGVKLAL
jgi:hypothetical protein